MQKSKAIANKRKFSKTIISVISIIRIKEQKEEGYSEELRWRPKNGNHSLSDSTLETP